MRCDVGNDVRLGDEESTVRIRYNMFVVELVD